MKSVPIKLSFAEEVKTFVNTVNRYPYEVDLRAGRHVVDAKSILGIFSLDLSKPITLDIYNDDCDDLVADIQQFTILQDKASKRLAVHQNTASLFCIFLFCHS